MEDSKHWQIILDICNVCKKMWQKGFVANHDGNVTAKLQASSNWLLATPTAVSKADIIPEIILTLDMDGKKIAGPGKPFSEISLHLVAYKVRPDIGAVVHAHPPYATARGACGLAIDTPFMPEAIVSLGDVVPVAPYSDSSGLENCLSKSNVFMIAGNGVLAVGNDVTQAYLRLELVEHLAKMDFLARQMGTPIEIPSSDLVNLLEKHVATGLDPQKPLNVLDHDKDRIRQIISEEIKSILS